MLNLHLRKAVNKGTLNVGVFGPSIDLTFETKHLGFDKESFFNLLKGKHFFSKEVKQAKNPLFLVGSGVFLNSELLYVNSLVSKYLGLSNLNIGVLNIDANSVSLRELGIQSISSLNLNTQNSYNLYVNTDLNNQQVNKLLINKFTIYCGSHGLTEVNKMDLILPGKAFSEKKSSFINLEGLLQITNRALVGLGDSREDWKIFMAFFSFLGRNTQAVVSQKGYENSFSLMDFFREEYKFLGRLGLYLSLIHI